MVTSQILRRRELITAFIYFSAALADSRLWVTHQHREMYPVPFWAWLCLLSVPLLFAFTYIRTLLSGPPPLTKRHRFALVLQGIGAVMATFLFAFFATPFWKNPVRDLDDSIALLFGFIVVLTVFLVAALSLLFRNKSSLGVVAAFLFWPYMLFLGLLLVDRFLQVTAFDAGMCFLCFVASVLFAFSTGAVLYRPRVGHVTALGGLVAVPWLYSVLRDSFGNVWLTFNVTDKHFFGIYSPLNAALTILAVAVIAVAIITAGLRMLPMRWQFRKRPVRERIWPAFAGGLLFLGIWFSQSVMPYRVPGMVTRGVGWSALQILHIEKRGLQFHETCVTVGGYRRSLLSPLSVYFLGE